MYVGIVAIENLIEITQETDGLEIFTTAMDVRDPLARLAPEVED